MNLFKKKKNTTLSIVTGNTNNFLLFREFEIYCFSCQKPYFYYNVLMDRIT